MKNDDISGSRSRPLHQARNKRYYYLTNEDIVGSRPQCNKFRTTRVPSNPLEPVYKLAKCEQRTATPPKFIRDNIQITDIEGAQVANK